ncbi:hypothetical protein F5888DRAFT_1616016 [Russula emetica]|nr:hypothetical protein F5888DRAFT_1616016 [Russula emetica]
MTPVLDCIETAADRIKHDEFLADKKRFESFKLGKAPPAGLSSHSKRHSHSRSHSRNVSVVSISPSPSLPLSIPSHDVSLSSSGSISSLSQLSSTSAAAKRGSHHRRCSSLSTRSDSAEVMGVSLPALSTSSSEDNIGLGDKDSVRRRALWALEGKPSPDGFSPVEIPELNTPEIQRRISELPSKPSFPPPMGSFSSGLSGLANMRDSFNNRPTSSIKDQLHTLVEEEEEDEEPQGPSSPSASPDTPPPAIPSSPTPSRARHRPAGLSLRPLSLSPEKLLSTTNGELPTPAPTPNSSKLSGLKSLTLTTSPPNLISSPPSDDVPSSAPALHRRCVVAPPIITSSASLFRRRSTDNVSSGSLDPFEAPRRRSSISYKSSFHGLPTPELTPTTTDRRTSIGSDSDCSRPSSVNNEQHFLYQSQAALIARISELERALAFRTQSCPVSLAASDMCLLDPAPTDEMLSLIADLKAERDELKLDIDGWRTRVADLQKQIGALTHRVDAERQEAWLARDRVGLLEIENRAAIRDVEESAATASGLKVELATIEAELQATLDEAARNKEAALELERVKVELAEERRRRVELGKMLEEFSLNASTPVVPARRVMSIDSLSSATDVESLDGHMSIGRELKAVQEVDEDEEPYSDQENHLIGYEDEEEGDESFDSYDGSSFSSLEDIPRSTAHLIPSGVSSPSRTPSAASYPTHARHYSLSREWSFPLKGVPQSVSPQHVPEEIDRFFGCLEDLGDSPPTPVAAPETTNPFSRSFFSAIEDDGNGLPPFVLPADVGTEVDSPPTEDSSLYVGPGLDVVLEEEEPEEVVGAGDEFIGEEDEGGIRFTFEIPPGFASSESSETPSTTPVLTPVGQKPVLFHEPAIENNDDTPFPFSVTSPVSRARASPPSPSAIPRATALKRFEGPAKDAKYPPSYSPSLQSPASQHTSPSNKYDGPRPSCLPQRITKPASAPTFIPQPATRARAASSM